MLTMLRNEWPLRYEVVNNNWWEVVTPVSRSLIHSAGQPWMNCEPVHQIHAYMAVDQNHFNNNQTQHNTATGTVNHNVVQNMQQQSK